MSITLPYTPPFGWVQALEFLQRRATPGVEQVGTDYYRRTLALNGVPGIVTVQHVSASAELRMEIDGPLTAHGAQIAPRIRRLFDLDADPARITATLGASPVTGPLVRACPGLRLPGACDAFEIVVRAIVGQQVSVKAATTLMGRIVQRLGVPLAMAHGTLTHLFPGAAAIAAGDLVAIGMPGRRVQALQAFAREIAADRLSLREPTATLRPKLLALPGIGPWTVEYIAMRALGDTDAFPASDLVLCKLLARDGHAQNARELAALAAEWRPWRAYAALHLWHAAASAVPVKSA